MIMMDSKETLFMGRITGFMMHEMKNVLAAIGENSALIQDVLHLSDDPLHKMDERIDRAFRIIDNQVDRGVELATKLHTFAYSADEPKNEVDLNEIIKKTVSLSERFARLKQVTLEVIAHDRPLNLIAHPLMLQMVLFDSLELIFESFQSPGTVVLRAGEINKAEAEVSFSSDEPGRDFLSDIKAEALAPMGVTGGVPQPL